MDQGPRPATSSFSHAAAAAPRHDQHPHRGILRKLDGILVVACRGEPEVALLSGGDHSWDLPTNTCRVLNRYLIGGFACVGALHAPGLVRTYQTRGAPRRGLVCTPCARETICGHGHSWVWLVRAHRAVRAGCGGAVAIGARWALLTGCVHAL